MQESIKKKYGLRLIVDASQEAGHREINLGGASFDAFIAPAHKGLMGVMGLGFCIFGTTTDKTLIEGGSGSESRSANMPQSLPEKHEAGTVALPAIAALKESITFIDRIGVKNIGDRIDYLTDLLSLELSNIGTIKEYGHDNGVLSFNIQGKPCEYVASELDKMGFCVRSGLHCAPLAHKSIGTLECGTVRLSLSYFNNEKEIRKLIKALRTII